MTDLKTQEKSAVPASIELDAVARLKSGDLSALEILVQFYQLRAVYAAVLILHDKELAEEIVQDCFFRAAQKIDQFDDRKPFAPWFLRSVINAALQEAKRQRRTIPIPDDEPEETQAAARWLVDPASCPEDLVESEELYAAVWRALDQLPPDQRTAVLLRYFQEDSEDDITRSVRRPLTTVKWWLHSARQQMRRILQRDYFFRTIDKEENHE
jgi:RNA polymerase sigma-70 factor, ECF subfamily